MNKTYLIEIIPSLIVLLTILPISAMILVPRMINQKFINQFVNNYLRELKTETDYYKLYTNPNELVCIIKKSPSKKGLVKTK